MRQTINRAFVLAATSVYLASTACGGAAHASESDSTQQRGTHDTTLTSAPKAPSNGVAFPAGNAGSQSDGEWTMPGRDYGGTRYSPLTDINTSNVSSLKVITTFSTGVLHGHEGQPLVVGSTMYVVTPYP